MNWLKSFLNGFTMPLESNPESGGARENAGLGNFTPHAQQVLALARREAARLNHHFVGTEHLLLGIVSLGEGVAVQVLRRLGLSLDAVRAEVEKHVGKGPDSEFMELEQSDGQIVLVPRHSMVKLCAPGTTPSTEVANDPR
jgi:hypothetical protein